MKEINIKAIIFDLDGVLADTERPKFALLKKLLLKKGLKLEQKLFRESAGVRVKVFLQRVFGKRLSLEDLEDVFQTRLDELYKQPKKYIKRIKGATTAVRRLHREGFVLAVASSSYEKDIELVLERLKIRKYFSVINGFSENIRPKPAPDIYLGCLEKLGLKGKDCVAIEDSLVGIEAAHAAGCSCIAVTTSLPAAELKTAKNILKDISLLNRSFLKNIKS